MHISTAYDVTRELVRRNRCSVVVTGLPGVGKSQLLHQIATALRLEHRSVEMAFYSTEDLCGMPWREEDNTTLWSRPFWFPVDDRDGLLVLEDVNRVSEPHILNCLMGLLLDRRLHAYRLPAGWRVAATLNVGHEFLATRLDPAHLSRVAILDIETDLDSVLTWGETHGGHPLVLQFLRANPTYLMQLPASEVEKPWPNPRAWLHGVGENLPHNAGLSSDPTFLQALVSTFVGDSAASAFCHWLYSTATPSCREILERSLGGHPARVRLATDSALLIQRLGEFVACLPRIGFKAGYFENLMEFLSLVPADALSGFLHAMETHHRNLLWTLRIRQWMREKKKKS